MKKMYKKPVTEKVALKAEIRCDESMLVGSCGNPVEGKMGNAPRRAAAGHGI